MHLPHVSPSPDSLPLLRWRATVQDFDVRELVFTFYRYSSITGSTQFGEIVLALKDEDDHYIVRLRIRVLCRCCCWVLSSTNPQTRGVTTCACVDVCVRVQLPVDRPYLHRTTVPIKGCEAAMFGRSIKPTWAPGDAKKEAPATGENGEDAENAEEDKSWNGGEVSMCSLSCMCVCVCWDMSRGGMLLTRAVLSTRTRTRAPTD